ncbi:MAG: hypothetical protein D6701_12325, partial [Gemmatimonadetes bacterium]
MPIEVRVTWAGGVVTSYRATVRDVDGTDPTGDTERDRRTHAFTLTGSLRPPGAWARTLQAPLTASILFQYQAERRCRDTAASEGCVAFFDELIRSLNLQLGTRVSDVNLRLQLTYTD